MVKYGYFRVSTEEQSVDRQVEEFNRRGITLDHVFIDHASGRNARRLELQLVLRLIKEGDELYVLHIDRLARSTRDLANLCKEIVEDKKCSLHFVANNLSLYSSSSGLNNAQFKLLLDVLGSIAEFESSLISERVKSGIAAAKKKKGKLNTRGNAYPKSLYDQAKAFYQAGWLISHISKRLYIPMSTLHYFFKRENVVPLYIK
jgi:DNA invertase Pin-like site-specific DNA recombinase